MTVPTNSRAFYKRHVIRPDDTAVVNLIGDKRTVWSKVTKELRDVLEKHWKAAAQVSLAGSELPSSVTVVIV